jgi:hypothetical protein
MKLEEIHSMWAEDSSVDQSDLAGESGRTPVLHAKYLRLLSDERMLAKKLQADLDDLVNAKTDRLLGVMPKEELDRRGWEPERRRFLKGEIEARLNSDHELINLRLRIALQKEKCDVLDSIVRMVMNRNFVMKNMIDWKKFMAGAT